MKNQSKIAIEWLNEIESKVTNSQNFRWIYHHLGEKKIDNFYVDGYDEMTDTVYEFMGCFYHRCLSCYDPLQYNPKCQKMFGRLHLETKNRIKYWKKRYKTVIIMKECDYIKTRKKYFKNTSEN